MALNHTGTVELRTERLVLRRFSTGDAKAMYDNWANDPAVTEFLTWEPHESPDATRALLEIWEQNYAEQNNYNWCITLDGQPVGSIAVVLANDYLECAEIGYCLGRKHWGKGIMPEALQAVVDYLFGTVGFHRIFAEHDEFNPKSGRVMQKCGMTQEGRKRGFWRHKNGEWHDLVTYSILRDEWRHAWLKRCGG